MVGGVGGGDAADGEGLGAVLDGRGHRGKRQEDDEGLLKDRGEVGVRILWRMFCRMLLLFY